MLPSPIFCLLQDDEIHCMDNIYRFNKQPVIRNETLSQHSWWTNFFAMNLISHVFNLDPDNMTDVVYNAEEKVVICQREIFLLNLKMDILQYSSLHDFVETITGDVNHELKYNEYDDGELRRVLQNYEHHIEESFLEDEYLRPVGIVFRDKMKFTPIFVKVCDWLALFKNVRQEVMLGNRNMGKVIHNAKIKAALAIQDLITACEKLNEERGVIANTKTLVRLIGEIKTMKFYE